MKHRAFLIVLLLTLSLGLGAAARGSRAAPPDPPPTPLPFPPPDPDHHLHEEDLAFLADRLPVEGLSPLGFTPCVDGSAGGYPCRNVDLLSFMPLGAIGGGEGNDIWGWTDPNDGKEYALMGRSNGTAFVDISDPLNPVYIGNLPTHTYSSSWRDIKVYADHAFIVADSVGNHGMQVFDLGRLRKVNNPPVTFTEDAHYPGFGSAHNIAINEASGYAYAVGSNTCSGGLHMVDIHNPTGPAFAGCVSNDGYTHDTQCVLYNGPDAGYRGREVCFSSNEDTVTIVDVSNKASPKQLSRTGYAGQSYTHQGWLTEDHRYFLLDDELDEVNRGRNTATFIWDAASLTGPVLIGTFMHTTRAIDHNLYVRGQYAYESNYRAGLRILDISGVAGAALSEAGYFDIYPGSDAASFNGSWSNYPYFESGVMVVSGIEQGLFVLRPNLPYTRDDAAYNVTYDGWRGASDPLASGGGYRATAGRGQQISLSTPRATSVALVTYRGPDQGKLVLEIDGVNQGVVDLYSPAPEYGYALTYDGLPNRRHNVSVTALGTRNPASSGSEVRVDAFHAGPRVIEDNQPAVRYNQWSGLALGQASGGALRSAARAGASVYFDFSGTQFTWITAHGPALGMAEVLVDGVVVATVDLYSPAWQFQQGQVLGGLAAGAHAVQIRALGAHNPGSRGNAVPFDGYSVP